MTIARAEDGDKGTRKRTNKHPTCLFVVKNYMLYIYGEMFRDSSFVIIYFIIQSYC